MQLWLRRLIAIVVLGTAFGAGRWTHAQAPIPAPNVQPPPGVQPQIQGFDIISGSDIGFRVDRYRGRTPVGTLVVRVNGQWVEPESTMALKRLTSR
jgi:hypothetical protein